MHQPDAVRGGKSGGDLGDEADGLLRIDRAVRENRLQVITFDEAHVHEEAAVYLPKPMDGNHMRFVQAGRDTCFYAEPALKLLVVGEMWWQYLDGNNALSCRVIRSINAPHTASAQLVEQPVLAKHVPVHVDLPEFCPAVLDNCCDV